MRTMPRRSATLTAAVRSFTLRRAFARQVGDGAAEELGIDPAIRGMALHEIGENDTISLSPDRQSAVCVMHCSVELEPAIGPSCPLVDMARVQGGGFVRLPGPVCSSSRTSSGEGFGRFSARRLASHRHQGVTRTLHAKVQYTSRAIAALLGGVVESRSHGWL